MVDRREFLMQMGGVALQSRMYGLMGPLAGDGAMTQDAGKNEPATVFWKSGAGPGQIAVLAGHALDQIAITIAHLTDHSATSAASTASADPFDGLTWEQATVPEKANRYAYVQIPAAWPAGQYALRIRKSNAPDITVRLNAPEVWWCIGNGGSTASPDSELRIFGQFLALEKKSSQIKVIDSTRRTHLLTSERANPYSLTVTLPVDLPGVQATVQVHNGFGGSAGWSEPHVVQVAHLEDWPSQKYSVVDFGAVGDSKHDDTAAFRAAIEAAGRNHGGVVFIPRGVYRITGRLTMPAKVTLRGEDRESVWLMVPKEAASFDTVIAGMGEFAVEELSIAAQAPMHIITAPDIPSQYTSYLPYGDTGQTVAPDVRLRRLRIHHLRYAHRLAEGGKDPRRMEDAGPSTIALAGPRMSIQDCIVVSPGMPIVLHRMSYSRVTGNEFRIGRNGWYGFWGASDSLIEGNVFEGQDLEASYGSFANYGDGSGPDIARLYIAGNRYLNSFGDEREAITFDSSGSYPWKGKLAGATLNTMTIDVDASEGWTGLGCLVTGGRGCGQMRKVAAANGRTVSVDSPWTVTPDETSTVAIMPFKRDVVVYENESQDTSVGVQLWGGGYNFIIDGNKNTRGGGFWGSAAEYTDTQTKPPTHYFLPLYFTQWLRNEVNEGFIFEQGPDSTNGAVCGLYIRDVPERADGGVLTFANIIRENRLHGRGKIVLRFYDKLLDAEQMRSLRARRQEPWSLGTLIEGNTISDSPLGIDIEPGFDGLLLRNNHFLRVTTETRM